MVVALALAALAALAITLPAPDALGWLLPDTAETLALLQELGKTCVFVCTSDEQRQHDEQGDAEGATDARGACENAAAAKLEALGLDESVVAAEQIAPDAVCSMPSAELAAWLTETYGLDPSRTLVVGDRTDTDVALAARWARRVSRPHRRRVPTT